MDNGQQNIPQQMVPPMGNRQPMGGGQTQPVQPQQAPPQMNAAPVPPVQPAQPQPNPSWLANAGGQSGQGQDPAPLSQDVVFQVKTGLEHNAPASEILKYFEAKGVTLAHLYQIANQNGLRVQDDISPQQSSNETPPTTPAGNESTQNAPKQDDAQVGSTTIPADDQLEAMERADLKKLGVKLRVWDTSCRYGKARMVSELAKLREQAGKPEGYVELGAVIEAGPNDGIPSGDPRVEYVRMTEGITLNYRPDKNGYVVERQDQPQPYSGQPTTAPAPTRSQASDQTVTEAPNEQQTPASVSRVGYVAHLVQHLAAESGVSFVEIASVAEALDNADTSV